MQTTWTYPAVFDQQNEGEIVVRFPDIPEALTSGETYEEALANAPDALEEAILAYLAHGRRVPAPREPEPTEVSVPLDPVTAARAMLQNAMAEAKLSKVAVAARMGQDEKVVRRILDGGGAVKMETVLAALHAIDVWPVLTG
jgi:antitoxin HicB